MTDKLEKITESVILKLTNRIAGVLIVPLVSWGLHVLIQLHDDNIAVAQELISHEKRISNLEEWRNNRVVSITGMEIQP